MPEHDLKPFDLVAAIGGAAARVDHVGADGAAQRALITREDVRNAPLGDQTLALVVHPNGGWISNELLMRPGRRDQTVVFCPPEPPAKHAPTLPALPCPL